MLASQRQALILGEVHRLGAVKVSTLVAQLGVSDMTVRRDIAALAGRGLVEKVHGGATAPQEGSVDEPGFDAKRVLALGEKDAIAEAAAAMVQPGMAVGLSAGTTTWTLAQHLADVPGITVVTNSMRIADVLLSSDRTDRTIVLTGGIRTPSDALVGPVAVQAVRSLHLDLVFLGVHGMSEDEGFTTPNLMESETNRALAQAGRRLVIVADHSKWGVVGLSTFATLDAADAIVTDAGLPGHARTVLGAHIAEVVVATTGAFVPAPTAATP